MRASNLDLTRIAQTNIALFRQAHQSGYAPEVLILFRNAYELATELFAGRFRPTGKPFVCHLVGTASVLAWLGAAPEIVVAGVLHAAYETNPHTGMVTASRQRIRDAVGATAEQHVFAYRQLNWNPASIRNFVEAGPSPHGNDARILLIRLANEVDDHLDHGMAYCAPSRQAIDAAFEHWIELAENLGHPPLAETLRILRAEMANSAWAQPLSLGRAGSYAIASPRIGLARRFRAWLRHGN